MEVYYAYFYKREICAAGHDRSCGTSDRRLCSVKRNCPAAGNFIIKILVKSRLLAGVRGKGGGYKLTRAPEQYTVGEILRLTEDSLAPVACLEADAEVCPRAAECRTLPVWRGLDKVINEYLDGITVADLTQQGDTGNDCVI